MEVLKYDFLILSLIFLIPGSVIFILRKDLRTTIKKMSLISLPFALAETLFYPSYWEPNFLLDMGNRVGFGLEDFIFVVSLASFTSTVYAFTFRKRYVKNNPENPILFLMRIFFISVSIIILILLSVWMNVPAIYSATFIMIIVPVIIILKRPDFLRPGILGGTLSAFVYFILCLVFNLIYPGVFEKIWNTNLLLNKFPMGVPLEELIYGFGAGFCATIIYPYIFNYKFGS
ncbi:lycopene cyclase domain-containing protein [uncultured Ilyobacter sp.]|uniref:lycopene cyclase domain-containing protein n=1 Tax=uncultured Ilyobacter sp. TaxID=544433 RepID=UPI0029F562E5|nr:lycopene cyclase domain-containing protein [uncultured Ilyobacter sp.]